MQYEIMSFLVYRIIVTTVPVYIAELSPKKLRGGFVSIMGVNVMGGILVGVGGTTVHVVHNLIAIYICYAWDSCYYPIHKNVLRVTVYYILGFQKV